MLFVLLFLILAATQYFVEHHAIDLWFQQNCVLSLGKASHPYFKALLCGESLPRDASPVWFQGWGLLHIMVVSGAHFIFLEHHLQRIFHKLKLPLSFAFPILILFSFATALQPPVLRSALSYGFRIFSHKFKYNWSPSLITLLSGLCCLFYVPAERHLSLQLSWGAALLVTLPCPSSFLQWKRQGLLWVGLLPLLMGLQWASPVSIFANALFLPFFEHLLFPWVWIEQNFLSLWGFRGLSALLEHNSGLLAVYPSPLPTPISDPQSKWIYLFCIQALALSFKRTPHARDSSGSSRFSYTLFS